MSNSSEKIVSVRSPVYSSELVLMSMLSAENLTDPILKETTLEGDDHGDGDDMMTTEPFVKVTPLQHEFNAHLRLSTATPSQCSLQLSFENARLLRECIHIIAGISGWFLLQ